MKSDTANRNNVFYNNLLLSLSSLKIGYVRRIEPMDEEDFYKMLQLSDVNKKRFENHWPYIIQSTRNTGYVYKNNKTRLYFYVRSTMNDYELVIVNMFGIEKIIALSILRNCAVLNNVRLCIKNISTDQLDGWKKLGYSEKKETWSQYSQKDDNSFPECIYDLEVIALCHLPVEPGKIRACRASHANKLRQYLRRRKIEIKEYIPTLYKDAVYELLIENAEFLQNKGVDSKQNVIDAHLFVFNDEIQHKIRLVHIENDILLGFNYLTVINDTVFGNALLHKNSPDLMRFLVWQGFNYLYNKLAKDKKYYVTLQGSENFGQYRWKKGFSPLMEIAKTHLTVAEDSK